MRSDSLEIHQWITTVHCFIEHTLKLTYSTKRYHIFLYVGEDFTGSISFNGTNEAFDVAFGSYVTLTTIQGLDGTGGRPGTGGGGAGLPGALGLLWG